MRPRHMAYAHSEDASSIRIALGAILRRRRQEAERSLTELAEAAELSPAYLSEVERGLKDVSMERLLAIAKALEVPVADVYLDFAATHPSLYQAMFQLPIDARFAQDDAETELRSGFNALGAALGTDDDGTATELLWSALHGMSLLERAGRMRKEHRPNRIAELAARFAN